MKIAVNGRAILNPQRTGIGRYSCHLLEHLGQVDPEGQYQLYVQKRIFDFKKRIPHFKNKNIIVKVDYFKRGVKQTLGDFDVYHAPSPEFLSLNDAKIIVTVHDLIYKMYPQGHTQETIQTTERQMRQIVQKAAKIICCSKNTRTDLHRLFNLPENRSCVIYQGVDHSIFYPLALEERLRALKFLAKKGLSQPFLLFVGTIEPRKNLVNVLKALARLKESKDFSGQLAIAGMKGWLSEDIEMTIETLRLKENVIFLGYVTDEELRYLYNMAEVFLFPSFYEGFGFPILEAFCCGAAVVTSNVSSCPEVAGDAALLVNPSSPQALAEAISKILKDASLKASLQQKALRRARDFSFLKTAQETWNVYKEICQS